MDVVAKKPPIQEYSTKSHIYQFEILFWSVQKCSGISCSEMFRSVQKCSEMSCRTYYILPKSGTPNYFQALPTISLLDTCILSSMFSIFTLLSRTVLIVELLTDLPQTRLTSNLHDSIFATATQ